MLLKSGEGKNTCLKPISKYRLAGKPFQGFRKLYTNNDYTH
jgi:hypothetical protein